VTVSRDPCGRWYVSFAVDAADPEQLPAAGSAVGVDLGIKDFAVTSGGEKIANPRSLARRERNLARYQRRLSRCQRGSANRAKAKAEVARAHRKVRAARADFFHKASTRLVRAHDVKCPSCGTRHDRDNQRREEHPGGRSCRSRGQPRQCLRS
jgi:putative transposase